ncbi:hypothetical protein BGZ94_006831 [Podila epigama]|nr:hypothetical protein BGZ94_006831 [Podila epigama]
MVSTTSVASATASHTTHAAASQLDDENRNQEIVASLRKFLKHQTAFKEYMAKRMTQEEYATICRIVTEGFVELSVEILALEAHLAGTDNNNMENTVSAQASLSTSTSTTTSQPALPRTRSLINSPEHAQLIREVQLLEKQKLALTVQGQKWTMEKVAHDAQAQKEREEEDNLDRVVDKEHTTSLSETNDSLQERAILTTEEWQTKLDENRDSLNQIVEDINEKLADIHEAIAVLIL